MNKIKIILYASKPDSSELEIIREEVRGLEEARLFLLPDTAIFSNGTKLCISIKKIESNQ